MTKLDSVLNKWNLSFADITGRGGLGYALTQSPCTHAWEQDSHWTALDPQQVGVVVREVARGGSIFTPKCLGQLLFSPSQGWVLPQPLEPCWRFSHEAGVNKIDFGITLSMLFEPM